MKAKYIDINQLYKGISILVLSLALVFSVKDLTSRTGNPYLIGAGTCFCIIMLVVFEKFKKNVVLYLAGLGSLIIFFLFSYWFHFNLLLLIRSQVFQWAMIILGIGILAKLLFRYRILKLTTAAILFLLLLILSIKQIELSKISIMFVLCYILSMLADLCSLLFHKNVSEEDEKNSSISLIPICLLAVIVLSYMPTKATPIQWTGVKNMVKQVQEMGQEWMLDVKYAFGWMEKEYNINFSGYSENSGLGGAVTLTDSPQLYVIGSTTEGNTYITGSVSDSYTGSAWEKSKNQNGTGEDYLLDYYELLYALWLTGTTPEEMEDIARYKNFTIEYGTIKTNTVFYPQKIAVIETKEKFTATTPNLLFDQPYRSGDRAKVYFLDLNYENASLKNMLREEAGWENLKNFNVETMKDYVQDTFYVALKESKNMEHLQEKLEEREARIQKHYTNLPNTVPQRVYDLSTELTQGYSSRYDKLRALETYLNTYTYTTTPKSLDKEKDFVDEFLFEEKEGYCTYFATSMAVMGRCIGIPTRYVEGFVLDYSIRDAHSRYVIESRKAHAWTEAYLEGIGWIPFEPTATYEESRYKAWRKRVTSGEKSDADDYKPIVDANELIGYTPKPILIEEKSNKAGLGIKVAIVAVAILAFILFVVWLTYKQIQKRKREHYLRASEHEKLDIMMENIFNMLQKRKVIREASDTLLQYSSRVSAHFIYDETSLQDVCEVYMKARYSNYQVTKEDVVMFEGYYTSMSSELLDGKKHYKMALK